MGNRIVALDQLNVSLRIRILDDTDGTPATGVVAATAGQEIWYQRDENVAVVTDAGSAANLALITTAHTDWGFIHIREGWYRVDFPDAAFAEGAGSVICGINATGFTGVSVTVDIGPFSFQGKASSATALTTTFPAGTDPNPGDTILCVSGTGVKQEVIITSVAGQVATHGAWPRTNISATTSTIVLIPGYAELANLDASVASRSSLIVGDLQTETAVVTDLLPTSKTVGGRMRAAIEVVNGRIVTGTGGVGAEWGDGGAET